MQEVTSLRTGTTSSDQTCLLLAGWLRGCLRWYHTIDPIGAQNIETMATLLEDGLQIGRGMGTVSIPTHGIGNINLSISGRDAHVDVLLDAVDDEWGPELENALWIKDGHVMTYRDERMRHVDQAIRAVNARATIFRMTRKLSVCWEATGQYVPMDAL